MPEVGTFDVSTQDIANTCYLISQRVRAQNEASLVAFSIKVIYDNGSFATHMDVQSFIVAPQ